MHSGVRPSTTRRGTTQHRSRSPRTAPGGTLTGKNRSRDGSLDPGQPAALDPARQIPLVGCALKATDSGFQICHRFRDCGQTVRDLPIGVRSEFFHCLPDPWGVLLEICPLVVIRIAHPGTVALSAQLASSRKRPKMRRSPGIDDRDAGIDIRQGSEGTPLGSPTQKGDTIA